jgi:hypothetical protein
MSNKRVSLARFAQLVRSAFSPFAARAMRKRDEAAEERPAFSLSPEVSWLDRERPGPRSVRITLDNRLGKTWP